MKYGKLNYKEAVLLEKTQTILYGVSYTVKDDLTVCVTNPVKGILKHEEYEPIKFYELGKQGKPKKSNAVHYETRQYADTESEAFELLEQIKQQKRKFLIKHIRELKQEIANIEAFLEKEMSYIQQ